MVQRCHLCFFYFDLPEYEPTSSAEIHDASYHRSFQSYIALERSLNYLGYAKLYRSVCIELLTCTRVDGKKVRGLWGLRQWLMHGVLALYLRPSNPPALYQCP